MAKKETEKKVQEKKEKASESSVMSSEGQEALDEYGESSEVAAESPVELDYSGPLVFQSPYERPMVGAINEEDAKQQKEVFKQLPRDYVGEVTERLSPAQLDAIQRRADRPREVRQEDVIDFPPPLQPEDHE